jgi:predicted ester cyclase
MGAYGGRGADRSRELRHYCRRVAGPAEFKKVRAQLLEAFPDLRMVVEATAADGDNVVVRWNARGTHRGSGFGIEATGTPVVFSGNDLVRCEGRSDRRGLGRLESGGSAGIFASNGKG